MRKSITVSAPAKIHLIGEHSVVYGKPAILTAINKRCFATVSNREDNLLEIELTNQNIVKTIHLQEVFEKGKQANALWQEFKQSNNSEVLKKIIQQPLDYPIICMYEVLHTLTDINQGFSVNLNLEIPFGVGMGSSAAMAVAIAGGVLQFFDQPFNKQTIFDIALKAEQKIHGNPSGGDIAACCFGKLITFQKIKKGEKNISTFDANTDFLQEKLFMINTGKPEESTGEMVSKVTLQFSNSKSPKEVETIFSDQAKLAEKLFNAIKNENVNEIQKVIKQAEHNLEKLGVVSKSTKKLITFLEKAGYAVKICGAGGVKGASGVVLIVAVGQEKIENIATQFEMSVEPITIGEEGVRVE